MIPYDIDPSLHDSRPEPQELGDGFSPPPESEPQQIRAHGEDPHELLCEKSPF